MSNQNNSSHDNYSTTKLKFEKFEVLKDNNRSRNNDENNNSNTIRASTLHQQIKTLITKIRDLRDA